MDFLRPEAFNGIDYKRLSKSGSRGQQLGVQFAVDSVRNNPEPILVS